MVLSELDRNLLERCLQRKPRAWEDFVDRFMGLVIHVVNHTAQARSIRLGAEDRDDLCAEVFLHIVQDDFAVLRHFRGRSSLATYLAVVARRIVVRGILKRKSVASHLQQAGAQAAANVPAIQPKVEQRLSDRDEIERMLMSLDGRDAQVVRMFHLEGKSYHEISSAVGMAENSIGPILSRARDRMRRNSVDQTTG